MTIREAFNLLLTGLLGGLVRLGLVVALGLAMSRLARADDYRCHYVQRSYPVIDTWTGQVVTRYRYVRQCYRNHVYHYPEREPTRVYGYTRREDDRDDRGERCKPRRRIVGDQHLTVDGARSQADKAWSQTVRFYHGEQYMAVENAEDAAYTCSRSSVGETLGQTFSRCELEARPCRPRRQEATR